MVVAKKSCCTDNPISKFSYLPNATTTNKYAYCIVCKVTHTVWLSNLCSNT